MTFDIEIEDVGSWPVELSRLFDNSRGLFINYHLNGIANDYFSIVATAEEILKQGNNLFDALQMSYNYYVVKLQK